MCCVLRAAGFWTPEWELRAPAAGARPAAVCCRQLQGRNRPPGTAASRPRQLAPRQKGPAPNRLKPQIPPHRRSPFKAPPQPQTHSPPPRTPPQALLANIAALYGVYHGPKGLVEIADRVHGLAATLAAGAAKLGLKARPRGGKGRGLAWLGLGQWEQKRVRSCGRGCGWRGWAHQRRPCPPLHRTLGRTKAEAPRDHSLPPSETPPHPTPAPHNPPGQPRALL